MIGHEASVLLVGACSPQSGWRPKAVLVTAGTADAGQCRVATRAHPLEPIQYVGKVVTLVMAVSVFSFHWALYDQIGTVGFIG
jgi:hypothetical protein